MALNKCYMTLGYLKLYFILLSRLFDVWGGHYALALQVMAFGSTPLKTYLPDGDIDLTVITSQNDVAYLVSSVCSILEEQICDSSPIKNVQVVDARVVLKSNFCYIWFKNLTGLKNWVRSAHASFTVGFPVRAILDRCTYLLFIHLSLLPSPSKFRPCI